MPPKIRQLSLRVERKAYAYGVSACVAALLAEYVAELVLLELKHPAKTA